MEDPCDPIRQTLQHERAVSLQYEQALNEIIKEIDDLDDRPVRETMKRIRSIADRALLFTRISDPV
jgi:hypothetical protein